MYEYSVAQGDVESSFHEENAEKTNTNTNTRDATPLSVDMHENTHRVFNDMCS